MLMEESVNNAKSLAQPNLRGTESQAASESTMSQAIQSCEVYLVNETSEESIQELPGTSQGIPSNVFVASSGPSWNNFMCPICLDTLKNTRITRDCFHRFCKDCIITALRRGNKECPVCRRKLISKRSLDSDPQLDALIKKMYPSSKEKEAPEEKALGKKKNKTQQEPSVIIETRREIDSIHSVHQGEKKQIETSTGWEDNPGSSPCNIASTHSSESDKASPVNKRAKSSGPEDDSNYVIVTTDPVTDTANEYESSLHATVRGIENPAQTGGKKSSGNSSTCQVSLYLTLGLA